MIFADNIQEGLSIYTRDLNADLLAMLERENSRSFFSKLFHRDRVKVMESRSSIPLLSFSDISL